MHIAYLEQPNCALCALPGLIGGPTLGIRIVLTGPMKSGDDDFAQAVLAWFDRAGRKSLPWQNNPTAYRVWLSEIMLQQTQVGTVIPYFQKFTERFPELESLARADIDEVLALWAGLGYYARARNLHLTAKTVSQNWSGEFPADIDQLQKLPGIGRSTAGAILSLAFGQRQPILDGNVKRVLARFQAVAGWPGQSAVLKRLWEFSEQYTPLSRAGDYNQAMMDLGALVCTRSSPDCARCPLATNCQARAAENQTFYPGRKPKKAKPVREAQFLLVAKGGELLLQKKPPSGIWGGLWSLPECDDDNIYEWCQMHLGLNVEVGARHADIRHSFTHFDLTIKPLEVKVLLVVSNIMEAGDQLWYNPDMESTTGMPAPVAKLLEQYFNQERQNEPHG